MTIRTILVDDQPMVRDGFRILLDARPELTVVGEASNGESAIEELSLTPADVVLMDVRMPGMNGIEATRLIARPSGPRVLILTTFDLDEYVYQALRAGASGFLLKDTPLDELVAGIIHVHEGDAVVAPTTTKRLLEHFTSESSRKQLQQRAAGIAGLSDLTVREREVFDLVVRGRSNAQIASDLSLVEGTVKVHVSRVFAKLHIRDRVQAVVLAYESGYLEPEGRLL